VFFVSTLAHRIDNPPDSHIIHTADSPADKVAGKKPNLWSRLLQRSARKSGNFGVSPTANEIQPLVVQLYARDVEFESNFPPGAGPARKYWPEEVINRLVNEDSARWELAKASRRCSDEIVQFILDHGKKLFAIAAVTEPDRDWLLQAMEFFHSNGFRDENLSAEVSETPRCLVMDDIIQLDEQLWRRDRAFRICDLQWTALVPVLSTDKANHDFDSRAVLPFKTVSDIVLRGSFSAVHKVEIHRDHLKDPSNRVSHRVWRRRCN